MVTSEECRSKRGIVDGHTPLYGLVPDTGSPEDGIVFESTYT